MNNYPYYAYLAAVIEDQFDPPGIQGFFRQFIVDQILACQGRDCCGHRA
jgi:hypothetical protein